MSNVTISNDQYQGLVDSVVDQIRSLAINLATEKGIEFKEQSQCSMTVPDIELQDMAVRIITDTTNILPE